MRGTGETDNHYGNRIRHPRVITDSVRKPKDEFERALVSCWARLAYKARRGSHCSIVSRASVAGTTRTYLTHCLRVRPGVFSKLIAERSTSSSVAARSSGIGNEHKRRQKYTLLHRLGFAHTRDRDVGL